MSVRISFRGQPDPRLAVGALSQQEIYGKASLLQSAFGCVGMKVKFFFDVEVRRNY